MPISLNDKLVLRKLGEQYMTIALLPVQGEKVLLWKALNRSRMQRPMVCIDQLPWNELAIGDELICQVTDPFWRGVEWDLRMKIYKWNHFPVDMVIEPFITIPRTITSQRFGLDAQVDKIELSDGASAPSQHYTDILKTYEDIEKIKDITFRVDSGQDERNMQEAHELFDGIAPVVLGHGVVFHLGVWDYLTTLMGIENAYFAIMDDPDFVHACMERVTQASIAGIRQANELMIHDDINNQCHCSYIYTDKLLPDFGQGKGPLSANSWAFGLAQLFTSVSPAVTEEFELPYITRMAEHFGMIYYGCCDRLDDRLDIVRRIPNVKKVSCSPWSDRRRFAEEIGGKLVMSNKPTPAYLADTSVNWDEVRKDLQYTADLARSNNINLEIILKDVSTVRCQPKRLTEWARIAMEVVQG
ncbi:MAG: uroporphyrinogen decarboxylase/cobalamine-independent methonine synthase family protein [Saccharofermentanales bacterium]